MCKSYKNVHGFDSMYVAYDSRRFEKAKKFREDRTTSVDNFDEFKKALEENQGFIYAHWDGTEETEERIKHETKATIRCIPLNNKQEEGKCILPSLLLGLLGLSIYISLLAEVFASARR